MAKYFVRNTTYQFGFIFFKVDEKFPRVTARQNAKNLFLLYKTSKNLKAKNAKIRIQPVSSNRGHAHLEKM